jgi:hypothetical protein
VKPFDIRLAERRLGAWKAGRGVSAEEAMADQLEAEKVGTTFGDEASLEAACRRARHLAKAGPSEEQDEEKTA